MMFYRDDHHAEDMRLTLLDVWNADQSGQKPPRWSELMEKNLDAICGPEPTVPVTVRLVPVRPWLSRDDVWFAVFVLAAFAAYLVAEQLGAFR